jgi:hypothetical protein
MSYYSSHFKTLLALLLRVEKNIRVIQIDLLVKLVYHPIRDKKIYILKKES